MVKNILFICKHNIFRSRTAEEFFKKYNKNKKYNSDSAGIIKWDIKDLKNNIGYETEKKAVKNFGINLRAKSKGLSSSLLKKTDILIIVADDVPISIFSDTSFWGKIIVWKISDVKAIDKNKKEIALKTIEYIEDKVKNFVKNLK